MLLTKETKKEADRTSILNSYDIYFMRYDINDTLLREGFKMKLLGFLIVRPSGIFKYFLHYYCMICQENSEGILNEQDKKV